jgi:hypothetical protein
VGVEFTLYLFALFPGEGLSLVLLSTHFQPFEHLDREVFQDDQDSVAVPSYKSQG